MDEPNSTIASPPALPPTRGALYLRVALLAALIALAFAGRYVLFNTPIGEHLRHRETARAWVDHHRVIAPAILLGAYFLCAILLLPVWWLQIIAGFSFGLVTGIFWCLLGSVAGAVASLHLSRWLMGDWFHARYESRMTRLREFDEKLGHNGLLVVMGVRLCHVLPFGLSNYLFGLTRITTMDVLLGTALGNFSAIVLLAAVGVDPDLLEHPLNHKRFLAILVTINLVLLIPLALRYLRPQWFQKIGNADLVNDK